MADSIDELPDRIEHRRRIAARLNHDAREHAVDDPSRQANTSGGAHAVLHAAVAIRSGGGGK